jgi:hypothetical protein
MTAPTPAPVRRPVFYRPIERHWYRLADFAQTRWARFAETRTCRFLLWLVPRLIWLFVRLLIIAGAVMVAVGGIILYSLLSMCVGNGAVAKGVTKGNSRG